MGLIDIYEGIRDAGVAAARTNRDVVDSVLELGRAVASASFQPPLVSPPGSAVAPGGPLQVGTEGAPRIGTGGGGGAGSQFRTVGSPLVYSMSGGGPAMTREDLELYAEKTQLASGGWVYVFAGHLYPGGGGVLSAVGSGGGGGSTSPGGRNAPRPRSTGNLDRANDTFRTSVGGSASAAASVSAKPITDRLDGLRADVQRLGRALEGDGGAGLRFGGGL